MEREGANDGVGVGVFGPLRVVALAFSAPSQKKYKYKYMYRGGTDGQGRQKSNRTVRILFKLHAFD